MCVSSTQEANTEQGLLMHVFVHQINQLLCAVPVGQLVHVPHLVYFVLSCRTLAEKVLHLHN